MGIGSLFKRDKRQAEPEPELEQVDWVQNPLAQQEPKSQLEMALQSLQSSKKGGLKALFMNTENSEKYTEVVEATQDVLHRLMEPVGGTREETRGGAMGLVGAYARLEAACDAYLARTARTDRGMARQTAVGMIKMFAGRDKMGVHAALERAATTDPADLQGLTWKDVVKDAREVRIQLAPGQSLEDFEKAGGGQASQVYIIESPNGRSFFKKEENYKRHKDTQMEEAQYRVQQLTVQAADEMKLSEEAKSFLAQTCNNDTTELASESVIKKIPTDAIKQELFRLRDAIATKKQEVTTASNIGFSVITNENRLNLRLDENKSANISRRNVATSRIADLLGVGDLIARSHTATIRDSEGRETVGNLMEGAKGRAAVEFDKERLAKAAYEYAKKTGEYDTSKHKIENYDMSAFDYKSGGLQKSMASLQVIDALCGQQDRHAKNYFIQTDENGQAVGVQGIDNDFAFGRTHLDAAQAAKDQGKMRFYAGDQKLPDVVQYGRFVLPHMDRKLAENILNLNDATVRYVLADLITDEEINWFLIRLHEMQGAIKNEMQDPESTVFIDRDEDWNEQTYADFAKQEQYEGVDKIYDDRSNFASDEERQQFDHNARARVNYLMRLNVSVQTMKSIPSGFKEIRNEGQKYIDKMRAGEQAG